MALGTIHVFSSNYEKDDFWALGDELIKFAKRHGTTANLVTEGAVRYQTILVSTEARLKVLRSGLKTLEVNYALLK